MVMVLEMLQPGNSQAGSDHTNPSLPKEIDDTGKKRGCPKGGCSLFTVQCSFDDFVNELE